MNSMHINSPQQRLPTILFNLIQSLLLRRHAVASDPRVAHCLLLTSGLFNPLHYPHLPLISINSLLRSLSHGPHPNPHLSLPFLKLMLSPSSPFPSPDHVTFPFILSSCALLPSLCSGKQIHGFLIKNGLHPSDHFVKAGMLKIYSRDPRVAQDLFDEMPKVDPVHYDILMSSYLQAGLAPNALNVFKDILVSDAEPDCFVLTTALTACAQAGALDQGVWIHRYLERRNRDYLKDMFIGSSLINMYSKCGCIDEAKQVFVEMPKRNIRVWSLMISAFAMHGLAEEAVGCLKEMKEKNDLKPDGVVLLGVLTACVHSGLVRDGLKIFSEMEIKYKVTPQHEHYSCVVDMLCRVGRLHEALGLIREMPMKPMVAVWGAFIAGCRLHKNVELAEIAVKQMQGLTGGAFENGDDEGVFVQLYSIYLHAGLKEEARRVRRFIGTNGIKKAPAVSEITIDGVTSSFVAGDQSHQSQVEIWGILDILADHMGRKEKCVEDILLDADECFFACDSKTGQKYVLFVDKCDCNLMN